MATTTTNLSLIKPAVNSAVDEDLWGGQLNDNMDTLDSEAATKTVDLDFAAKVLSDAEIKDFSEDTEDIGTTSGALAVDYLDGHYQFLTLNGNASGLTISNPPATGKVGFLTIEITQDGTGGRTIDLTGGTYRSAGAVILTVAGGSIDKLRLETRNAGTTWDVVINNNFTVVT